jgi:hypothetical protein
MDPINEDAQTPNPPELFGRPTYEFDSPELVGSIMAELANPEQHRQAGRMGIPRDNVTQERPATAPAKRFSAVRGRQLRTFKLDTTAGFTDTPIDVRGNCIHYRRSETGPAGVNIKFDDGSAEQVWLPAGGFIMGAIFDRVLISAAATAGFAHITVADDPRQDKLTFGTAA